ncbi:MAG TPA: hypothetical protein V6D47_03480 [Oscillatoriaceae cyanobacterium]
MAGALETYYDVLFRPSTAFARPLSFGLGALTLLLISAVLALSSGGTDSVGLWLVFLALAAWAIFTWLAGGAIAYILARAWHAPVEPGPFYAALALATLPWLLAAPLGVIGAWGAAGHTIAGIGGLVVFVWWLVELVLAVRGAGGMSTGRAIAVLVLSAVLPLVLPALVLTFGTLGLLAVLAG